MRLGFMNRRNGYGNIYTPHAGSMIIQVQRETGLANRTIILSQRQVALLRIIGSRIGLALVAVFIATWLLFAAQSVRVPVLSIRIAKLERDNRRNEQVRQMLAVGEGTVARQESTVAATGTPPNAKRAERDTQLAPASVPDTTKPIP